MLKVNLSALFLLSFLSVAGAENSEQVPATPESVMHALRKVANWELAFPNQNSKYTANGWVRAAFYSGVMALAEIVPDKKYENAMVRMAKRNHWKLGARVYHADDQAVGATYEALYLLDPKPERIAPTRKRLDFILAHRSKAHLNFFDPKHSDRWSWCDSLFMAPPVWAGMSAITHNPKYLAFVDHEWWHASDYLYDEHEHLFYRDGRFIAVRVNDRKIFWARGNGWVIAGLARLIPLVPPGDPSRARYVEQFKDMAARLKALQLPNGFWSASLLNPDRYPQEETSGTGFNCFALAWGINQGLLKRSVYEPAVLKAWAGLNRHVSWLNGRFDGVQPTGDRPAAFSPYNSHPFGVGAFLLAGTEVYRLLEEKEKNASN